MQMDKNTVILADWRKGVFKDHAGICTWETQNTPDIVEDDTYGRVYQGNESGYYISNLPSEYTDFQPRTMEAWVKFTGRIDSNHQAIFRIGSVDGTRKEQEIYIYSGKNFAVTNYGNRYAVAATVNNWCHLCLVHDNGKRYFFVDGVLKQTVDTVASPNGVCYIGWSANTYAKSNLQIACVRMSNIARWTSDFIPPDGIIEAEPEPSINIADSFDTKREIHISESFKNDLLRGVVSYKTLSDSVTADIQKKIQITDYLYADLQRKSQINVTLKADVSLAKVNTIGTVTLKTSLKREIHINTGRIRVLGQRKTINKYSFKVSLKRVMFPESEPISMKLDFSRTVFVNDVIRVDLSRISGYIRTNIVIDLKRKISKEVSYKESLLRRIPHDTTFYKPPQTDNTNPAMVWSRQNPKQAPISIEISLNELALSDTFSLTTTQEVDINEMIAGTIIDYQYQYQIGDVDWQDLTRTCGGMYDCDEIIYRPITYFIRKVDDIANVTQGKLSEHAAKIASALGKKLVFKCDDFIHTSSWTGNGNTYQSIISTLFGWSSSIPHMAINVFLRAKDNTLYIIQRGQELSVIDITDTKHTRPHIKREIERTLWTLGKDDDTATDSLKGNGKKASVNYTASVDDDKVVAEYEEVESGQQGSAQTLLKREETADTVTTYSYTGGPSEGGYRLYKKVTLNKNDYSHVDTTYVYSKVTTGWMLVVEREQSLTKDNIELFRRETLHHPLGNGGQITEVLEGVWGHMQLISTSVSEGVGTSNQYRAAQETYDLTGSTGPKPDDDEENEDDNDNNDSGSTMSTASVYDKTINYSAVPTENTKILKKYTDAIIWLNRKVKETIEMDIYGFNHVIDFTERVVFKENEYYLSSNTISQTTRNLKQSVKLVRWYQQ